RRAVGALAARAVLADAALGAGELRERARPAVACEHRDGVAARRADVDVASVAAHRDAARTEQRLAVRARAAERGLADAAVGALELGQLAGLPVAREDRDRVPELGGDVDVLAVAADRDRAGADEAAALHARAVRAVRADARRGALERRERAGARVALEGEDGVPALRGDVDVASVGAGHHAERPAEKRRLRALGGAVHRAQAARG